MLRLSPRQIQSIGTLICGDGEDSPTEYRRYVDIEGFFRFTGVATDESTLDTASRWKYACSFIEAAQASGEEGASGLARNVEMIIEALLDLREFHSEDQRDEALLKLNQILTGISVEARVAADGSVQVVSTRTSRSQRVLDEQIHTVFGEIVSTPRSRYHERITRRHSVT